MVGSCLKIQKQQTIIATKKEPKFSYKHIKSLITASLIRKAITLNIFLAFKNASELTERSLNR